MFSFLKDPLFSIALSFLIFMVFIFPKGRRFAKNALEGYANDIQAQISKAQELLEKATSFYQETCEKAEEQKKQREDILMLARVEAQNILEKSKVLCLEFEKAKQYFFDQQCNLLRQNSKKIFLDKALSDLENQILSQLTKNASSASFSFLKDALLEVMHHQKDKSIH